MTPRLISRAARAFAAALTLSAVLGLSAAPQAQAQQPQAKPAGKTAQAGMSKPEHAEKRIADLHEKLGITPAQEAAWTELAQVMRANAEKMKSLIDSWSKRGEAMNAVESLKIHGDMAEEHAKGLRALIPAFEKLYTMMTDDQKKIADQVFARHEGRSRKGK